MFTIANYGTVAPGKLPVAGGASSKRGMVGGLVFRRGRESVKKARIYEAMMSGTAVTLLLRTPKLQLKMEAAKLSAETLRSQIAATEKQLQELRDQLAGLESPDKADSQPQQPCEEGQLEDSSNRDVPKWPLNQEEYNRYGRQMIVSSISIKGL